MSALFQAARIFDSIRWPFLSRSSSVRAYDAANQGRLTQGWVAPSTNANREIAAGRPHLVSRSRDLGRNNPHGHKIIELLEDNVVGEGIRPRPVGLSETETKRVLELWDRWSEEACADVGLDVYGVQALTVRGWFESGETIVRRRWRRMDDGLAVPLQLQVIESDQIDSVNQVLTRKRADGTKRVTGRVVDGIEFDAVGRRAAYHLLNEHPGDTLFVERKTSRIPASEIVHLFRPTRPGQVRGVPWMHAVIRALRDFDKGREAERVRRRLDACVSAFVTGDEEGENEFGEKWALDAAGNPVSSIAPGLLIRLRGGKDVKMHTPTASGGYEQFASVELHGIAAGALVTYELLTGDLSRVNYSSIRAGMLGFHKMVRKLQKRIVVPLMCRPMWRWFIEAAVAAGELPGPVEKYRARWVPPRVEAVDRLKEALADRAEARNGTLSLVDLIESRGGSTFEEQVAELARVAKALDDAELVLDTDPRRTTSSGAASDALLKLLDDDEEERQRGM